MSIWVGMKVIAELVTATGGLIFLSGLALRGRSRDIAVGVGAALIGISGFTLLAECLFGLLDPSRYAAAILQFLFGAGVTTSMVRRKLNCAKQESVYPSR